MTALDKGTNVPDATVAITLTDSANKTVTLQVASIYGAAAGAADTHYGNNAPMPPGTYKITMWHAGFRPSGTDRDGRPTYDEPRAVTRTITLAPKAAATVDFELK